MDVDFHPHTEILFATTGLRQQKKIVILRSIKVRKILKKMSSSGHITLSKYKNYIQGFWWNTLMVDQLG
jgi:hypothetical protein